MIEPGAVHANDDTRLATSVPPVFTPGPAGNRVLGFWIFLSGECAFFASLIGTYLALHGQTAGGPSGAQLFDLPMTGLATVVLLSSSLTGVLGTMEMQRGNLRGLQFWLWITAFLGLCFIELQGLEFFTYYRHGLTFQTSAFSSAFYALVGFHGLHVTFGVVWLLSLLFRTMKKGITKENASKIYVAGLYWHFVDVVWVIIFTVVYLMGKAG